jgi:hypothetical protein
MGAEGAVGIAVASGCSVVGSIRKASAALLGGEAGAPSVLVVVDVGFGFLAGGAADGFVDIGVAAGGVVGGTDCGAFLAFDVAVASGAGGPEGAGSAAVPSGTVLVGENGEEGVNGANGAMGAEGAVGIAVASGCSVVGTIVEASAALLGGAVGAASVVVAVGVGF